MYQATKFMEVLYYLCAAGFEDHLLEATRRAVSMHAPNKEIFNHACVNSVNLGSDYSRFF